MTEEQDLRSFCLELACNHSSVSDGVRLLVATAAAYEEYITAGEGGDDLERLIALAENTWVKTKAASKSAEKAAATS